MAACLRLPTPGVDHVHLAEARRGAAVGNGVGLRGLALSVVERPADEVAAAAPQQVERVPELGGAHLIGNILQHRADAPVLDLVEHLPAELRVEALLVDGVGAAPLDQYPVAHAL